MRYGCPLCDFKTNYMVQFRKHLDNIHPEDDDKPNENIKINEGSNTQPADTESIEMLKLKLEVMELKLQIANKPLDVHTSEHLVKVIHNPIHSLGGNLNTNDFLFLREIVNNSHRNMVLNKGFMTAVIEILNESIERYGEKRFFPIACTNKVNRKLMFYMSDGGWTADNSVNKYLHKVICRIGQILCNFNEDDEEDVRWMKNKEHWLILVNACFAWDLPESEVYCKKKIERAVCELLYVVNN